MTEKELLSVLDMSEQEQYIWVINNTDLHKMPEKSLADLAFRLRYKTMSLNYHEALLKVYCYRCKNDIKTPSQITFRYWLVEYIAPIDMIIAALTA